MRPQKLPVLLLLSGVLAILPAQAADAAGAPVKQHVCKPCTMPLLPVVLPRHGMVLAFGSTLSTTSLWYMVDLERGEASRIVARYNRAAHTIDVVERTTRPIPDVDLVALKKIARRIWANRDWVPTHMATDSTWDLWQLDGGDVRRDFGIGVPDGLAKDAQRIMARLLGDPAPP